MKKKYFKFGFTLIEVMIATVLLISLCLATAGILKSTLDSTVAQKTQQSANNNAKAIMSAITTDLQSSTVLNGSLLLDGNKYHYPSSVLFPSHGQKSSCSMSYSPAYHASIGILGVGNNNYSNTITTQNNGKLIFISQDNNNNFQVIEYVTNLVDNRAVLNRNVYDWDDAGTWPGIRQEGASAQRKDFAIDGMPLWLRPANTGTYWNLTLNNNLSHSIVSLPNIGDAIYLRTDRNVDEYTGKLSPNKYNIKVIVFQSSKDINALVNPNIYFRDGLDTGIAFRPAFFDLFINDFNDLSPLNRTVRKLYKFCELNSSVSVRTSAM